MVSIAMRLSLCCRPLLLPILGCLLWTAGCEHSASDGSKIETYTFCFEQDLAGWTARGMDLDNPPVKWKIDLSNEMATCGSTSVRFYLENTNDAGKIWLERAFGVKPHRQYIVTIEFDFATRDFGMANLWRLIAGACNRRIERPQDLPFREHTGNGSESDVGYRWLQKKYVSVVDDTPDTIYVMVGVWGTWETQRTYFFDNITVAFEPL